MATGDDKSLLELCLKVSGGFENGGGPSYTAVVGNFDGEFLSAGILQWNLGQGTLQPLLIEIGTAMGWDKAQTYFKSDIHHLALCKPADAAQFCLDHYIEADKKTLAPEAKMAWQNFLGQPESIAAQVKFAINGILARAKRLALKYCLGYPDRVRPIAFFFDLITQQGGMQVGHTVIPVVPAGTTPETSLAIVCARGNDPRCADMWTPVLATDPLAVLLVHYAYERSLLGKVAYQWDTLSRRGSIACRVGIVHEGKVNFTEVLD
jgi:hypothetical protein